MRKLIARDVLLATVSRGLQEAPVVALLGVRQLGKRGGEPCARCGTTLKDVRLAGRGTVYCPRCQR